MKTYRYEIEQDQDPTSPFEWDNLGTIAYKKGSRYTLGNEALTREEMDTLAKREDVIILPVYAYIHSGIALNTTGFSCPWDSGQSGFIYVEKEKVKKEWKVSRVSAKLRNKVEEVLRGEVETFNQYLSGDVYGYRVFEKDESGEETEVDSCWGYYGEEYCKQAAEEVIAYHKQKKAS
jgi:hypothetical protein